MAVKLSQRVQRLEDMLKTETSVCMIAAKSNAGIKWNGVIYPNEDALSEAAKKILGDVWERPLILLKRG